MQTDEVKAAACVLKQPFLTFERILGLDGPGLQGLYTACYSFSRGGQKCVCITRLSVVKMQVAELQKSK